MVFTIAWTSLQPKSLQLPLDPLVQLKNLYLLYSYLALNVAYLPEIQVLLPFFYRMPNSKWQRVLTGSDCVQNSPLEAIGHINSLSLPFPRPCTTGVLDPKEISTDFEFQILISCISWFHKNSF